MNYVESGTIFLMGVFVMVTTSVIAGGIISLVAVYFVLNK